MDYISQINVDNTVYSVGLPNIYINSKGNFNIETSSEIGNTSKGKINIESMDDIQFKPGDDIIFYSHHRAENKQDEVAMKVTDGDDIPVKLLLNAAELVLTTKDKTGNNADVMDVTVNSNTNTRGYLKVRAQAIDLRCEKHGGIALLPKGYDGDGNMNKIKFEHGGGDGLEFGTFNTEKTSLYTDEYRFKKDGIWKMATRTTEASGKTIVDEGSIPTGKVATGSLKYVKQDDDFYDIVSQDDEQCTTKDIIKTAYALNGSDGVHTKITSKGNLELGTKETIKLTSIITDLEVLAAYNPGDTLCAIWPSQTSTDTSYKFNNLQIGDVITREELVACGETAYNTALTDSNITSYLSYQLGNNTTCDLEVAIGVFDEENSQAWTIETVYVFSYSVAPDINIESLGNIKIDSAGELKLKGVLDFGSTFGFGETDGGIEVQYKKTKKNAVKDCGVLKVVALNNSSSAWTLSSNDLENLKTPANTSISAGSSEVIAECSIYDIIKLVNYMKTNNQGPWETQATT